MPKWAQLEAVRVGKGLQGKLTRTIQSHGGCYQPACSGADVHQQSAALPAHRWAHGALDPDDAKQVDFEQLLKLLNCVAFGQTHRRDVMTEGLFAAPACKGYGKTMVDQAYDRVGSPVTVGLKDANLKQAAADSPRSFAQFQCVSRPPARCDRAR